MLSHSLPNREAWEALQAEVAQHQAFSFDLPAGSPSPDLLTPIELELKAHGQTFLSIEVQVVLFTEGRVAVLLPAASQQALAQTPFPALSQVNIDESDKPLWVQYESMTKAEKIKLARQGNAEGRRLISRDLDQSLHLFLLQNPGLGGAEMAKLIRSGGAGVSLLKSLNQRPDLMGNPQVIEALVANPKTPTPMAVQLVAKLPLESARRIAKTGRAKAQIVTAARKRVIKP